MNPWLTMVTDYVVEYDSGTSSGVGYIPTAYSNSQTTTAGELPYSDASVTGFTRLVFPDSYTSNDLTTFAGYVRPRWVRIKITYTGTKLNEGGTLTLFHGPDKIPLNAINPSIMSGGATRFVTPGVDGNFTKNVNNHSIHRFENEFEFYWYPADMRFRSFNCRAGTPNNVGVAGTMLMPDTSPYIPCEAGAVYDTSLMDMPWCTGFHLQLANNTSTTAALPLIVEITRCVDYSMRKSCGTLLAFNDTVPGNVVPQTHPIAEAQIHNTLAHIHKQRQKSAATLTKSMLRYSLNEAKQILPSVAEGVGERLAASLV